MKRIILMVIVSFFAWVLSAQEFTFRGHTLDCTVDEFCKFLESEGFDNKNVSETSVGYEGQLMGYDNAELIIGFDSNTKKIKMIIILPHAPQESYSLYLNILETLFGKSTIEEDVFYDMNVWKLGETELQLSITESPTLIFRNHINE